LEIITSHNALDFDGLASMIAAGKIYPSAVKVFAGTLSKNVKQFMALYKDMLMIKTVRDIDVNEITRMIIVDTANINRLGHLKEIAKKPELDFHIYDHHPSSLDDLSGSVNEIHQVGAATTIMVEEIIARNISINSFEATIFALGIYEDTGSMIFSSTTPQDVSVVAFLLSRGANLSVVATFMEQPFSSEQRQLLQDLLDSARHYRIKNLDVVIASSDNNDFIPGLDMVTHRLLEVENADVVFSIVKMQNKINIVGRSRTNNVKTNEILKSLGGRGHEKASSAVVKGKNIQEVIDTIVEGLGDKVHPALLARDIMSTPVKTIPMYISMEEAEKIMLRYGHSGMPVVEEDEIVGVISRRDVDKAKTHNLGHAPVKGFMTTGVISVEPDTPVREIQRIMVEYDIGRLPVVNNVGKLIGIVSRTDILRTLHGDDCPDDYEVLFSYSGGEMINCMHIMQERLPSKIINILRIVGQLAENLDSTVYCVGGFVRDLFLQVPNFDLDLVVEGDGKTLARKMAEKLGGYERIHERFQTALVVLPDGTKIDVATARTEYYEFPAALPRVERSSIKEDLYRRDFTINTLALNLNPDKFGDLIDYFGGRKDLENGYIRILYNMSFVEDPTRIIRAIRFEQRYNFSIEKDTLRFAREAIQRRILGKLSYKRIMHELKLILNEKDPVPALERMNNIGVWEYVLPEVDFSAIDITMLKRVPIISGWWKEKYCMIDIKTWMVYLLVLISQLNQEKREDLCIRYHWENYVQKSIKEATQIKELIKKLMLKPYIRPSELDAIMGSWNKETVIYMLLSIHDEKAWDNIIKYLDRKEKTEVEINGHDLQNLGLKPGPVFRFILDELYKLKLNDKIKTRDEELATVREWLQEGKI